MMLWYILVAVIVLFAAFRIAPRFMGCLVISVGLLSIAIIAAGATH